LWLCLFTFAPSGMNSMWTIPDEPKNSSSIALPFDLSCCGFFFLAMMAISRWPIVSSVVDHTENAFYHLLWSGWESSDLSALLSRSQQVLMQLSRWPYVRMCGTLCSVTWNMFRPSDRNVWHVPWLIPAATSSSVWHTPALQLIGSWVQLWLFLADRYAHHLPNCLSPVQNVCALWPMAS
jgi:hypothetical protein